MGAAPREPSRVQKSGRLLPAPAGRLPPRIHPQRWIRAALVDTANHLMLRPSKKSQIHAWGANGPYWKTLVLPPTFSNLFCGERGVLRYHKNTIPGPATSLIKCNLKATRGEPLNAPN